MELQVRLIEKKEENGDAAESRPAKITDSQKVSFDQAAKKEPILNKIIEIFDGKLIE